jgi:predicted ATPase/class 3 adenylate cyclase/DNA-binding XRE family transcriptional regulator
MEPAAERTFGAVLAALRRAATLTQEELAERAGLSPRGLSYLERGAHLPQPETVRRLATALDLTDAQRASLVTAAQAPQQGWQPTTLAPAPAPPPATSAAPAPAPGAATPPAAGLPTGTLTFLLTDIDGSTGLWEHHPDAMQAAVAQHDALIEEVLSRHGGRQVKERGEGDSIFAVFTSPSSALAAVCALQQALLAEPWPAETPLRVRMGLHTGEAELRGLGYYGVTVNRTARIRSLAHGGQSLLSQATADLVRGVLPAGVTLRPLGTHRLKGLEQPEEIYQVVHSELPADFPPLVSPVVHPSNLPVALTSFIGRAREQAEVRAILAEARLVTLTGAGGVGKTRLALTVAAELVDQYADGVWLVELAALAEPGLVPQAVAQVLGVREQSGRSLLATLLDFLQEKHLLLVLDNCEHLIAACANVASVLLRACPHLSMLATSREGLEVAGEQLYRVPSLTLPDPQQLPIVGRLPDYAAVRLFLERARARQPRFGLTEADAAAVVAICARLDGIPLAIELAAARVTSLSVEAIAARLDDCFRLLTGGTRDALPRQRTLRATLDWSYDLLSEDEQRLLARLSVFAGSWTLKAAEEVGLGNGLEAWEVLDLLGGLVNKSLVQAEEVGSVVRYRLLETMRQYGLEQLAASGEEASVRDRHLAHFLALAEQARLARSRPEQGMWLNRLQQEHDDFRSALAWSTAPAGAAEAGLRLVTALWWFWWMRGYLSEGRRWLESALAASSATPPALRAGTLIILGSLALEQGDTEQAAAAYTESQALCRAVQDSRNLAASLTGLGNLAFTQGDHERAAALLEECLALYRDLHDEEGLANALINLGEVCLARDDFGRAGEMFGESLALCEHLKDQSGMAASVISLGDVMLAQSDHGRAEAHFGRGLALYGALSHKRGVAAALRKLGYVASYRGECGRAARLLGAAEGLRDAIGASLLPTEQTNTAQTLASVRAQLGDAAFTAAYAAGRTMTLEESASYALDVPPQ